jgi:riboflavin synthase
MFTGLVEEMGRVLDRAGARLVVSADCVMADSDLGASVAVNGACLTVVERGPGHLRFDLGPETLARTALADLAAGDGVNLERPLRLGGLVGGHLVQGHVDGVGIVVDLTRQAETARLTIEWRDQALAPLLIPQGSVTVDGVSLTVARLGAGDFEIMIIPHTLAATTLGGLRKGQRVNLEMDMIGKYVQRMLQVHVEPQPRRGEVSRRRAERIRKSSPRVSRKGTRLLLERAVPVSAGRGPVSSNRFTQYFNWDNPFPQSVLGKTDDEGGIVLLTEPPDMPSGGPRIARGHVVQHDFDSGRLTEAV